MKRFTLTLTLSWIVLATAPDFAWATEGAGLVCKDRAEIVASLAQDYAEAPVSMGFTDQGTVLEILAGPDGSWTMIETLPSGTACLVANGQMWRDALPSPTPSSTAY